jgi:RNA polymerase sigma factor (sigma-70 family)
VALPPFQTLLDQHGPDLHRFLVATAGPQDAGDCFQETMLAALRSYDSVSDDSNLRGWLFTIAHHKVIDGHRRRGREAIPLESVPEIVLEGSSPGDESLWAAVRRLPDKQRAAVACRFVLDLPYREVGEIVGCTESAARQNVRQAISTLRQEVA